jgi:hypothetical protein
MMVVGWDEIAAGFHRFRVRNRDAFHRTALRLGMGIGYVRFFQAGCGF